MEKFGNDRLVELFQQGTETSLAQKKWGGLDLLIVLISIKVLEVLEEVLKYLGL